MKAECPKDRCIPSLNVNTCDPPDVIHLAALVAAEGGGGGGAAPELCKMYHCVKGHFGSTRYCADQIQLQPTRVCTNGVYSRVISCLVQNTTVHVHVYVQTAGGYTGRPG